MVRTLSTNLAARVATLHGTEPYYVLKVEWDSGTIYYASKDTAFGGQNCKPYIQNVSDISAVTNSDNYGESAAFSVTLFDKDATLKTIIDTDVIERTVATLYMMFENIDNADALILLRGVISGDIAYSELDRKLSFDIESVINSDEVGYAPEEDEFTNLSPDGIEKAWPLCYGTVLRVPAVPVYKKIKSLITVPIQGDYSTGTIVRDEVFEEATTLTFDCEGIRFTGTVSGRIVTFVTMNDSFYTNVPVLDRPVTDASYFDTSVCWIDTDYDLTDKYCILFDIAAGGWVANWCTRQEGTKCRFAKPWGTVNQQIALDSSNIISDIAGFPKASWVADMTVPSSLYNYNWRLGDWEVSGDFTEYILTPDSYELPPNSVFLQVTGVEDTYVCNLGATTEILEVYGYRQYKNDNVLMPIPSSYYTTNLGDTINGKTCTTITFEKPLADYGGQQWDGTVFVSLISVVGSSTPDIIEDILTTYTNITVDAASFASVAADLTTYPSHVAFLSQQDAIQLCEEVAYQARCALYVYNNVAYLKYLSKDPGYSLPSITDDSVVEGSVGLAFTTYEDVETRTNVEWTLDYTGEEDAAKTYVYKNNIDTYGLREEDRTYEIYNIRALVKASVDFWGYRDSNIWRIVTFTTPLQTTALQIFDDVSINLSILSTNAIRGIVIDHSFAIAGDTVTYKVLLASRTGDADTADQPQEDSDFWSVAAVSVSDPGTGLSQVDYIVDYPEDSVSGNMLITQYVSGNGSNTTTDPPIPVTTSTTVTPTTTAGPGCPVSDSFTRADESPLGAPYTLLNFDQAPTNMVLVSSGVQKPVGYGHQMAVLRRIGCSADCWAQIDYSFAEENLSQTAIVGVRIHETDCTPSYLAVIRGDGRLQITKNNACGFASSYTTLASDTGMAVSGTLKLSASGTTIKAYIDGIEKLSTINADISGQAGIGFGGWHWDWGTRGIIMLDNFLGGDL